MSCSVGTPIDPVETQLCRWHALSDLEALHRAAAVSILAAADRALRTRAQFHLVLAGGNTPVGTYRRLRAAETDWSAWHVYFGDERCLPSEDPARNSPIALDAAPDHVPIPAPHRHFLPAPRGPMDPPRRVTDHLPAPAASHPAPPPPRRRGHSAAPVQPGGRLTAPDDVARGSSALSGAGTGWLTGNVIRVDGGEDIVG